MEGLRLERGWSRAELARRARMDASDVGRIEKGLMTPYPAQAEKLGHARAVDEVAHEAAVIGVGREHRGGQNARICAGGERVQIGHLIPQSVPMG